MIDPPAAGHPAPRVLAIILTIAALIAACGADGEASGSPPRTGPARRAPPTPPAPSRRRVGTLRPNRRPPPMSRPRPPAPRRAPPAASSIQPRRLPAWTSATRTAPGPATWRRRVLQGGDPPARYVQVGPFACAAGERCATTLAARPEGDVVIEFDGGEGINVHLKVAPDGSFDADRQPAMGIAVPPASASRTRRRSDALHAGPLRHLQRHRCRRCVVGPGRPGRHGVRRRRQRDARSHDRHGSQPRHVHVTQRVRPATPAARRPEAPAVLHVTSTRATMAG